MQLFCFSEALIFFPVINKLVDLSDISPEHQVSVKKKSWFIFFSLLGSRRNCFFFLMGLFVLEINDG